MQVFERMCDEGIERNAHTYATLIACCGKANQYELAEQMFLRMQEEDIPMDAVTYGAMITAASRCNKWKKAVNLLKDMTESGNRPNSIILTSAMNACKKANQWDEIIDIASIIIEVGREKKRRGCSFFFSLFNLEFCAACFGSLGLDVTGTGTLCSSPCPRRAQEKVEIDITTFTFAMNACGKLGDSRMALALLRKMKRQGIRGTQALYTSVITALQRDGRGSEVQKSPLASQPASVKMKLNAMPKLSSGLGTSPGHASPGPPAQQACLQRSDYGATQRWKDSNDSAADEGHPARRY